MFLLVGLGNPGSGYSENRHNIGFMAADEIVRRHSFAPFRKKFQGEVSEGTINGQKVLVLKPQTYMNESGRAVGEALRFYKLDPSDVIVFYDELDLPLCKVKIKTGGGAGGHNGIRSLDAHIGKDYRRVRMGIGHPGHKDKVHGHVLSDFGKKEKAEVEKLIDELAREVGWLVDGNDANFMNRIATALNPPKPKPERKKNESLKTQAAPNSGGATEAENSSPFAALAQLKDKLSNN